MSMFTTVAPLRERVLDEAGMAFLAEVWRRRSRLLPCRVRHLPDCGMSSSAKYERVRSLEMFGMVTFGDESSDAEIHITRAGELELSNANR